MKLRYQMRGLGIGIIVTSLLMGVVKGEKVPLSDAEIKVRAMELGMVESDSLRLSDIPDMSAPPEERQPDAEDGAFGGTSAVSEEEAGLDDVESTEGEGASEPEDARGDKAGDMPDTDDGEADPMPAGNDGKSSSTAAEGDIITVVIEEGVTSYSVCQLLEELGLVEDADSLDYYICSNSYSRIIQEGTYEIAKGTDEEEIVRIIMGNK